MVSPYVALMSCCRRFLMFLRSHWFFSLRSNTSSINSSITLSGMLSSTCRPVYIRREAACEISPTRSRPDPNAHTHVVVELSRDAAVFGVDVRLGEEGRHLGKRVTAGWKRRERRVYGSFGVMLLP